MERLYNIQLSSEGKVIRIVGEQLLQLPLKFHLSKLSRVNDKQNPVPNSEYPRMFLVTGANQNARKLLSTDLVNTK